MCCNSQSTACFLRSRDTTCIKRESRSYQSLEASRIRGSEGGRERESKKVFGFFFYHLKSQLQTGRPNTAGLTTHFQMAVENGWKQIIPFCTISVNPFAPHIGKLKSAKDLLENNGHQI